MSRSLIPLNYTFSVWTADSEAAGLTEFSRRYGAAPAKVLHAGPYVFLGPIPELPTSEVPPHFLDEIAEVRNAAN